MKKFLLITGFLFSFILTSCIHNPQIDFEIRSPRENWSYSSDKEIDFISNLNSENLEWASSLDGVLGTGPSLKKKLSTGEHKITLTHVLTGKVKSVNIIVKEAAKNDILVQLLQESMNGKTVELQNHDTGLISVGGSAKGFSIKSVDKSDENRMVQRNIKRESDGFDDETLILRDLRFGKSDFGKLKPGARQFFRNAAEAVSDQRTFKLINTITQMDAHDIESKLVLESDNFYVYVDNSVEDYSDILKCMDKIEKVVYSRVVSIWGKCADIDGNGKVTILFSPVINSEGVAVGFFNQKDFFTRDTDTKSDSYNPFSNEMDILYVCVPSEENANYSESSICATIAHELTHAINFSEKTYKKVLEGVDSEVIEVFLDEGLSHLTESLIGLGETGGNQKFVNRYLSKTANYSFCDYDSFGSMDSVYQRGAMSLFLYYLFDRAGGFYWDETGKILEDNGGISFLRKIIASSDYGWKAIGDAFGQSVDEIFNQFAKDILTKKTEELFDFSITDPITSERIFVCDNISVSDVGTEYNVVNYSIIKFANVDYDFISIGWNESTLTGNVYFINF